jgi:hypothetical protein
MTEVAFDGEPESFGVGVAQTATRPAGAAPPLPGRLFTFTR